MKKFITFAAVALIAFGTCFAQTSANATLEGSDSYANIETVTKKIEDKYASLHEKAKTVEITMEYTPLTGDVILYYKCMASNYDQGDAMNTAMAVYEEFAEENKYKHYTYTKKDTTKYTKDERGIRMATYISRVRFTH